jgi:hypothetical protein
MDQRAINNLKRTQRQLEIWIYFLETGNRTASDHS